MKKQRLTFFLTLLLSVFASVYAQQTNFSVSDTLRLLSSEELIKLMKHADIEKSDAYEQALIYKIDSKTQLVKAYYDIGYFFYKKEEYERSIHYNEKALQIQSLKNDPKFLRELYQKQGNAYLQIWKNQEALDSYHNVLRMIGEDDQEGLQDKIKAKSGIAIVLRRMNQSEKALHNLKESLHLIKNTSFHNARNHVNILTIISEVYLDLEQLDSVLYYSDMGIKISKPINYEIGLVDLYTKKGIVLNKKGEIDKALKFFIDAEKILLNTGASNRLTQSINVNYFLADYYYQKKSFEKAIAYLKKTVDALKEDDYRKKRVVHTYFLLAKCYIEIKEEAAARHWFSKYEEIRKEFEKQKDQTILKIFDTETQLLDKKIEKLNNEQVKEERNKIYILWTLGSISVLLIFIIWMYFQKQKSNKKIFEKLIEKISILELKEEEIASKERTKDIAIDDEKVSKVLKGLERLEEQQFFLNLDCNLRSMAKKVRTNATYLSKIINTHKDKSFNDYINDLRIEYVLKRLKNDRKFRSFSIKSMAYEIGYKSDNSFVKHFKLKTGLNPSYYIRNIEKFEKQKISNLHRQ